MKAMVGTCLALVALGVFGGTAGAAVLPPGNSGATQYAETIPGAGGNEASTAGKHGKGVDKAPPGAEAVATETATELKELGPAGEASLRLAEGTAPKPPKNAHHPKSKHRKKHQSKDQKHQSKDQKHQSKDQNSAAAAGAPNGSGPAGSSGVGEVLGGLTSSSVGGMGVLQPLLILATAMLAVAYAARRRRGEPHR